MADNKSTISDEHLQVYIGPKCKDHGKQIYEEYFSLVSKSGIHMLYNI